MVYAMSCSPNTNRLHVIDPYKFFTFMLSIVIILTLWAPYIGSWLANYVSLPAGAMLRDLACYILMFFTAAHLVYENSLEKKFIVFVLFILFLIVLSVVIMSFDSYILIAYTGSRPYVIYPAIFFVLLF